VSHFEQSENQWVTKVEGPLDQHIAGPGVSTVGNMSPPAPIAVGDLSVPSPGGCQGT